MSGKLGVEAIEGCITVIKLAAISVLQSTQKDGFQYSDLFAPLQSATFQIELEKAKTRIVEILPEIEDVDFFDGFELGRFLVAAIADVKTELTPALVALKKFKKA